MALAPVTPALADLVAGRGLVHLERLPAREARYGELARPLPDLAWERLGVDRLWAHQAEAIDLVRDRQSVVLATGTASGKSLCYQAPIAEAALAPVRPAAALCIFPTKALAQDQARALFKLELPGLVPATYDGDCSTEERSWARSNATVLLTNPEMLHSALLPHHRKWSTYLARLEHVVVDELHVLRGIFGTHVSHLLRRLRRVCQIYGSDPTFVFCSATIGQPGRLASDLCGLPVAEVTDDASPKGERLVALWNPAVDDEVDIDLTAVSATDHDDGREPAGPSRSTNKETAELVARLVREGHRTIAFCRSRRGAEVVAADIQRRLPKELRSTVAAYRGGYLAAERREIEAELFDGRLRAVVATTALELGIDVGGLDACVLNGFPGTIASLWQQAGRAGREGQESVAVLVAGNDQLDQWLMANPREVFSRPPEPAVINPANPYVLLPHLACAAYEKPLTPEDDRWWGDLLDDGVRRLVLDDQLRLRPKRDSVAAVWSGSGWPAHGVGLRSGFASEVRIVSTDDELVGTVDLGRAPSQVHPGAVYLHQGRHWRVTTLDLDGRRAVIEPFDGSEWTQPRTETNVRIAEVEQQRDVGRSRLALGSIEVSSQVVAYRRRDSATGENLGTEDLDLPVQHLSTRAVWYTIDPAVLAAADVSPADAPGTLHAVEHCAIGMLPLFTICDRWDVGGVSTMYQTDTGLPTIAIYDGYPGGAGIADLGFEAADRHLHTTLDALRSCGCDDGCPSCVQSPKCGNFNEPLDKAGAVRLLATVLSDGNRGVREG
jgi:DEAD/DEAH box helicase domain-containing protein